MTRAEFERKVVDTAVPLYATYPILPSVILAQAALESGWGKSGLTVNGNSLFGIKATSGWKGRVYSAETKECYDGVHFTNETAVFRAYDSWRDSIIDHSYFLCNTKRYAKVVGETDFVTACNELQRAGYATDPEYADKLIRIIRENGWDAYDIVSRVNEDGIITSPAKVVYIVQHGDTLNKIANRHKLTVSRLVSLNKIVDPDKIYAGEELKLN